MQKEQLGARRCVTCAHTRNSPVSCCEKTGTDNKKKKTLTKKKAAAIVMLVISLIETTVYMSFKNEYWLIVVFIAWMLGAYLSMFVEMIGFIIIRKNKNTNAILMRKLMFYFAIKAISFMPIFVTSAIISLIQHDVTFVLFCMHFCFRPLRPF